MFPVKRTPVLLTSALALALLTPAARAADLWFHVEVHESTGEKANVHVNLPLSLIESAVALIPEETAHGGRIRIEDKDFNAAELRRVWSELKNAPDATFVTVKSDKDDVQVAKQGGYLVARVSENSHRDSKVHARIPLSVVDALLTSEDPNQLNIAAAVRALAAQGAGDLVTVDDQEASVRVWIDSQAEGR
ncbi:MAG: hypothetical protein U0002_16325 [Thermoanaerobaculia bacterium]